MRTYDGYLIEEYVNEFDWPEIGEIYIALDLQNRLGPQTWLVAIMGDGTSQGDAIQLGLFWKYEYALHFARLYEEVISHDIRIAANKSIHSTSKNAGE